MRRLSTILAAAVLAAVPALPATVRAAPAPAAHHATTTVGDGAQLARLGGLRSRSRYGYGRPSTRYPYGYGRRPRGRGVLRGLFHGLFWGWLLSHLLGGAFPLLLPLIVLVLVLAASRRRPGYRTR